MASLYSVGSFANVNVDWQAIQDQSLKLAIPSIIRLDGFALV